MDSRGSARGSLPVVHAALLRAAARWVPRPRRDGWLREWRGELAWTCRDPRRRRSVRLLLRVLWSLFDALSLRMEELSMQRLAADVRLALRSLRRSPGFSLVAILTLGLGIGANTAIFSVVNGVLIKPLPYPDPERLVSVNFSALGLGPNFAIVPFSDGFYVQIGALQRSFEPLGISDEDSLNLVGEGEPERLQAARVTDTVFGALQVTPLHGRLFTPQDGKPGAEPVVILGHDLWRSRFGGDPGILDTMLELDGVSRRVVGIMPPGFAFPRQGTRIWTPYEIDEATASAGSFGSPGVARLAPGATVESASAELRSLLDRLTEIFPDEFPQAVIDQAGFAPRVLPYKEVMVGDIRRPLLVVLGTVGFVLLIACANVANLFLVRAEARQREITLRAALGARGVDLARVFLTESMLLAFGGGLLGVLLAVGAVDAFIRLAPVAIPRMQEIGVDPAVLAFCAAASVLSGLLFGALPLLRTRTRDLAVALREGGRSTTLGSGALRTRNLLVVAQVSLALMLLVGSGLMMRSFQRLRATDPGVDPAGVLTLQVALPSAEYRTAAEKRAFWDSVLARVRAVPGVEVAGAINHLPLGDSRSNGSIEIEGHAAEEGSLPPLAEKKRALPGAFETLGIPLLEGRVLREGDGADQTRAVVVSAGLARHWWPGESALGKRLRDDDSEEWYEIVGVVGDVHFTSIEEPAEETVYYPAVAGPAEAPELPGFMSLVARTGGDPRALAAPLRQAIWEVDPRQPITKVRPLATLVEESLARTSFTLVMLGIAAAMAVFLGAIGIYGVISYLVGRRAAEIGIRIALGASAPAVRHMVVRHGLTLAGTGIGIGLAGALALSRVLSSLLYEVSATDPATYVAVAALVAATALLASWVPALRASGIDPVVALREE